MKGLLLKMSHIQEKYMKDIDVSLHFFDSLRDDYAGFNDWFLKKASKNEKSYVFFDNNKLLAFLYLKIENPVDNTDMEPKLNIGVPWLKIGTLKIEAHGTKLGERFIKRIFDFAIANGIFNIYVTVFKKQNGLINLLERYGFVKFGNKKHELVLIKNISRSLEELKNDIYLDYPSINITNNYKYILSIYPEYHTRMFSDSILKTEKFDILQDMSESNSIHKVYITKMNGVEYLNKGDCLFIYRTMDRDASNANYSSVITSLCVVEEYRHMSSFKDESEFVQYCKPYNIFTYQELSSAFKTKKYPKIIKMTYNISFKKRVVLAKIREILKKEPSYWGFVKITDGQFLEIIEEGLVDDRIVIN